MLTRQQKSIRKLSNTDRKPTKEVLKAFFSAVGAKLKNAQAYQNGLTPLHFTCKCGNPYQTNWRNKVNRCMDCSIKSRAEKRSEKSNWNSVIKAFRDRGCVLLSESKEYENNRSMLKYLCQCGKTAEITLHEFKLGQLCTNCEQERRVETAKFNRLSGN